MHWCFDLGDIRGFVEYPLNQQLCTFFRLIRPTSDYGFELGDVIKHYTHYKTKSGLQSKRQYIPEEKKTHSHRWIPLMAMCTREF
jgi:hypothetical protein